MEKLFQRKKRNSLSLFLFLVLFVTSCTNDTPSNSYTFRCTESSRLGLRNYSVDFYKVKNSTTKYLISNFHKYSYDGEYDITADITGDKIEITPKDFNAEVRIMSGNGTVNADFTEIKIDYIVQNSIRNETIEYTVIFSR